MYLYLCVVEVVLRVEKEPGLEDLLGPYLHLGLLVLLPAVRVLPKPKQIRICKFIIEKGRLGWFEVSGEGRDVPIPGVEGP